MRVLTVEDHADTLELNELVLQSAGAEVRIADSAEAALALLDDGWRPNLVVTNVRMPSRDGYYLLAQMRARGCDIPVLAISASVDARDRERIRAAGFCGQMDKPMLPEDFCATVARLRGAASEPHDS